MCHQHIWTIHKFSQHQSLQWEATWTEGHKLFWVPPVLPSWTSRCSELGDNKKTNNTYKRKQTVINQLYWTPPNLCVLWSSHEYHYTINTNLVIRFCVWCEVCWDIWIVQCTYAWIKFICCACCFNSLI